jgi:bifunctional UDP-N-acetylglucosamine pyrophosphorylase/glucosamine-1-phosphate N-acetyltransferase
MNPKFKSVILAAGKSTRMKSAVPKFMFKSAGKTLLEHVADAAHEAGGESAVVVSPDSDAAIQTLSRPNRHPVKFYTQDGNGYGTGYAVISALNFFADYGGTVVILFGADPLITPQTIANLVDTHEKEQNSFTVVSAVVGDPASYGRIVRKNGLFSRIAEFKDANESELLIKEINTGVCAFSAPALIRALDKLGSDNAANEYYLTDVPKIMLETGLKGGVMTAPDHTEFVGVDTRADLAEAGRIMRARINRLHMMNGVTIINPENTYIDVDVKIGQDTEIHPNACIHGETVIGMDCLIRGGRMENVTMGDRVSFENSVAVNCSIGSGTTVGPFAYIRPGSKIGENVRVGDFVEIKNSVIGGNSAIAHLAYVGDCDMGENVNFSCGAITANFDGRDKYRTIIRDGAFIGCNTNLVAPVVVGQDAFIAAGSTITEHVPENALAIARGRQTVKPDWKDKKS